MKYTDAKKQIEALSSKYDIDMSDGDFNIIYKRRFVSHTYVIGHCRYAVICDEECFHKLPFSNKLYMILAELAMTPLDERVEEKKYYVKVYDSGMGYLNINNFTGNMSVDDVSEVNGYKTKFTNKDIDELKKRGDIPLDWNKVTLEEAE